MSDRKPLPTCETCRFWEDNGKVSDDSGYEDRDRYGYCRRYPPVWMSEDQGTYHPEVMSFNWCGEHQPATVADTTPAGT